MSHGGNLPYEDLQINDLIYERTFSVDLESEELVWHRDKEDRLIEVLAGEGWKFQRDNHLPQKISPGDKVKIKKEEWHRIIKGETNLKLLITMFL
jgi:hypothetical protein